jgi:hypothetical protein
MTTRIFNTPEELMMALLQGEKWSLVAYGTVFLYDKKYPLSPFRAMNSDGGSDAIDNSYNYCDGKTLWYKVEEKPKKKTVYIIKFYSTKGKVLEMDKSKLTQMPKNIIDEYEIEANDE